MGSLVEEHKRREGAARAEADRLRSRSEELSRDLDRAEEQVSRLVIAREEVARVLEPAAAEPLLVLSADCKGIVMRPGALQAATAKATGRLGKMRILSAGGEKPNRKRMAAL